MVTVALPPSVNSRGAFTIEETFDVDDPVKVDLVFYKKNRAGDLDNRIKPVCDALNAAGLRNIVSITARFKHSDRERTEIMYEVLR